MFTLNIKLSRMSLPLESPPACTQIVLYGLDSCAYSTTSHPTVGHFFLSLLVNHYIKNRDFSSKPKYIYGKDQVNVQSSSSAILRCVLAEIKQIFVH